MILYLAKRLLLAATTLLAILFVSYLLLRLSPGDPTRSTLLGGDASGSVMSSEKNERAGNSRLRQKLHLDDPIHTGFLFWLGDALRGDFGSSAAVEPGRKVTDLILERMPITLKLNVCAIILTYLLAIPIGIFAADKPDSWFDRSSSVILFMLYSLPAVWVGLVLQATLCKGGLFPIFPVKGVEPAVSPFDPWWLVLAKEAAGMTLPVVCLAYSGFAGVSRYARASMVNTLRQNYIRTATAKGVSRCGVLFRHALRNSLITLITLFSGILPSLIAGSIIVEQIFGIPGMGSLSIASLSSRDYPLQMAIFTFAGALTLIGILLADLLYTLADPRINFSGNDK